MPPLQITKWNQNKKAPSFFSGVVIRWTVLTALPPDAKRGQQRALRDCVGDEVLRVGRDLDLVGQPAGLQAAGEVDGGPLGEAPDEGPGVGWTWRVPREQKSSRIGRGAGRGLWQINLDIKG